MKKKPERQNTLWPKEELWPKGVNIPHDGHPTMPLHSKAGLLLAEGYERVVFLKGEAARVHGGPYIEMNEHQVRIDNAHLVPQPRTGYIEFRSNCAANVKVYFQQAPMKYSESLDSEGYKVGFYYIAVADIQENIQEASSQQ